MRAFALSTVAIPVHLAFIAIYLVCASFIPEGIGSYLPLVCFIAGLWEIALLFPSARHGESPEETRTRVRRSMTRDAIFFASMLGVAFLVIQTLNGPRQEIFDLQTAKWTYSAPPIRDFPTCFDQLASLQGILWALLSASTILAVRNAMGRNGRLFLLRALLAISAVAAITGLIAYGLSDNAQTLPTFESPAVAGAYFLMHFAIGSGLFLHDIASSSRNKRRRRDFTLTATLIDLIAAYFSLSPSAIIATSLTVIAVATYTVFYLRSRRAPQAGRRLALIVAVFLALIAFLNFLAYPKNRVRETIVNIFNEQSTTVEQQRDEATTRNVAWRIFDKNSFCGIGLWGTGFQKSFGRFVKPDEWDDFVDQDSSEEVFYLQNDFLQFLIEYGVLGSLILASPFLILCASFFFRATLFFRSGKERHHRASSDQHSTRLSFTEFFNPLAITPVFALIATFCMSFHANVFHNPLIIFSWSLFFAAAFTFLPKSATQCVT